MTRVSALIWPVEHGFLCCGAHRLASQLCCLAKFSQGFVECRPELGLEPSAHLLQLCVDPADPSNCFRKLLGTENDQSQKQDDANFASGKVEHTVESRDSVAPGFGRLRAAELQESTRCNSDCRH